MRQYEVVVTVPMTLRVWAANEEEAKKEALLEEKALKAIGFPIGIEVREIVTEKEETQCQ